MSTIVAVHSFRGGTGKSNTAANLSALLALDGYRVGVIDTDIQSPGVHVLFDLDESRITYSLNDYLWGKCMIDQAAHDVTGSLSEKIKGKVYLVPSSPTAREISRVLHQGYDVNRLNEGFTDLIRRLRLDFLIVDTHPGLNEETLMSVAISDLLLIILRPDHADYQGTSVTVEVARKLDVPRMMLMVNKVPDSFDPAQVKARVEQAYNCEVVAVVAHSDAVMTLASAGVFAIHHPTDAVTAEYRKVVRKLTE